MTFPTQIDMRIGLSTEDTLFERSPSVPVADPLWMLQRQFVFGEFQATDIGSPSLVRMEGESNTLTTLDSSRTNRGDRPVRSYAPALAPLEAEVETYGRVRSQPLHRQRIRMGLDLARRLVAAGLSDDALAAFRIRYALKDPDSATPLTAAARRARLHVGHTLDGYRVLDALRNTPFPSDTGLPDQSDIRDAVTEWAKRYRDPAHPLDTWRDDALTHSFDVAAPEGSAPPLILDRPEIVDSLRDIREGLVIAHHAGLNFNDLTSDRIAGLMHAEADSGPSLSVDFSGIATQPPSPQTWLRVEDYDGTKLDWYHFSQIDRPASTPAGRSVGRAAPPLKAFAIPTTVRFPGMPLPRYWSVESPGQQFSHLDPAPEDLARLMVSDFAVGYDGRWSLVPISLHWGSLTRLDTVRVRDVFGREASAQPQTRSEADPFAFCELTQEGTADRGAFFLCPTLPHTLTGPDLERLDYIRDGGANMAWAIERRGPDDVAGRAADLTERALAQPRPQRLRLPTAANAYYDLATDVPANYFPLTYPADATITPDRRLELGVVVDGHDPVIHDPKTSLLSQTVRLRDEALPPDGRTVRSYAQRVRWVGGRYVVWQGRHAPARKPESGTPGLVFDQLADKTAAEASAPDRHDTVSLREIGAYYPQASSLSDFHTDTLGQRTGSTQAAINQAARDQSAKG